MFLKSFDIYDPSRHIRHNVKGCLLALLFTTVVFVHFYALLGKKADTLKVTPSTSVDDAKFKATISQKIARHFARISFLQAAGMQELDTCF